MSLVVVGSVALDSVETPVERRDNILGGAAVHFSYAASYFAAVRLVGVVGDDFPDEHTELLRGRGVDLAGLQVVPGGKTFRWTGKYHENLNDRDTLEVHLNVFGEFNPVLPEHYRECRFVFLANGVPAVQAKVLDQVARPALAVADTMDLWINIANDELRTLMRRLDGIFLNDHEAKLLADDENLIRAGRKVLGMGPKFVVIKKGEHGAIFFSQDETFVLPAYPTERVIDPTGAGDSFAGGFMGYVAAQGKTDIATLKQGLAFGTVVASFNVEDFGLDRMHSLRRDEIDRRFQEFRQMLSV